jgi:hypothetical protein
MRLLFLDELQMSRRDLVRIVGSAAFEDEVQHHIVAMVVDGASKIAIKGSYREVDDSWVAIQILVTGGQQTTNILGGWIVQRKVNHVRKLRHINTLTTLVEYL